MTNRPLRHCVLLISICTWQISCNAINEPVPIDYSLEPIVEVSFINGTENTQLTVNRSQEYYFLLTFNNTGNNNILEDGTREGWCIDWETPINSNGGVYNDISLYSTFSVEKWKPLNFLLNIKKQLTDSDPGITHREIQLAIWSLRGFPKFDLDEIPFQDLPSSMRQGGEPAFNREKVDRILEIVENGYRDFAFIPGTKFAVIAETPADVQTVITVAQ